MRLVPQQGRLVSLGFWEDFAWLFSWLYFCSSGLYMEWGWKKWRLVVQDVVVVVQLLCFSSSLCAYAMPESSWQLVSLQLFLFMDDVRMSISFLFFFLLFLCFSCWFHGLRPFYLWFCLSLPFSVFPHFCSFCRSSFYQESFVFFQYFPLFGHGIFLSFSFPFFLSSYVSGAVVFSFLLYRRTFSVLFFGFMMLLIQNSRAREKGLKFAALLAYWGFSVEYFILGAF